MTFSQRAGIGYANIGHPLARAEPGERAGDPDEAFAGELERAFLDDLEHAREITLEEWNARSGWGRAGEVLWKLFAEQL